MLKKIPARATGRPVGRRGKNLPPLNPPWPLRLEPDIEEAVLAIAKQEGREFSNTLRWVLRLGIEAHYPKLLPPKRLAS